MDQYVNRQSVWQTCRADDISTAEMKGLFCYNPSAQWLQSIFLHGIDLDWITRYATRLQKAVSMDAEKFSISLNWRFTHTPHEPVQFLYNNFFIIV